MTTAADIAHAAAAAALTKAETRESLLADAHRLLSRINDIAGDPSLTDEDRDAIGDTAGQWSAVQRQRMLAHGALVALEAAESEAAAAVNAEDPGCRGPSCSGCHSCEGGHTEGGV